MSAKTHTVTITLEVTEEELKAGHFCLSTLNPGQSMTPEDLVEFHLKPALQLKLRMLRSEMKWKQEELYNHPGLLREVFVSSWPARRMSPLEVRRPVEGTWECSASPTGLCWYDDLEDTMWDSCLFCGEPHERK